jgi:hypothetical protein
MAWPNMTGSNFNYALAQQSQGVDNSMYSSDPEEAQKMMMEDFHERWRKDKKGFQRDMIKQNAQNQKQARSQRPANNAQAAGQQAAQNQQQQGQSMFALPNPQQQFAHHSNMVNQVNDAWREEMNARVAQQQAGLERAHQERLASIQAQGQQRQQYQQPQNNEQQYRTQKNNALMRMMGYGNTHVSGPGGHKIMGPFEAMSQSLLAR